LSIQRYKRSFIVRSTKGLLSLRTLPAVIVLLLFIANPLVQFGLGPFDLFGSVHGQTEPPASGDWIISDITSKTNTAITLKGNLTVKLNGRLTLDHVDLKFNSTAAMEYKLTVESGGMLYLKNTTVGSLSTQWRYTVDLKGKADIRGTTFEMGGRFLDSNTIKITYSDVLITQSIIKNASGSAIFIYPGYAPKINNNTILGGEFGIFINDNTGGLPGSNPIIANNTINETANTAIYIGEGTTPFVFGNRIFHPGNRGIHIQYTNAVVTRNYIYNADKEAAIFLYGNSNKPNPWINNNTIENCVFGFTASGPTKGRFDNNTIMSTTHNGIVLQWNTEIAIIKNKIFWSGDNGIYMRELADPMVRDNTITGNEYGIKMESRTKGTIYNNKFNGGRYGLWSSGSSPVVQSNMFSMQSVTSINMTDRYSGRDPVLLDNDISVTNIGIDITQSNPLVQGNDIMKTNLSGINLGAGASPVILGNNLTFNNGRGIWVHPGATPVIRLNSMTSNLYGMVLEAAHMTIEDNQYHFNDFAVQCDQGTDSVFHNNTFDSSTFFDFLVRGDSHPTVSSSPVNESHVAADMTSSLKIQWTVDAKVVNSKGVPEVGAMVTFRDNSNTTIVHSDKTKAGGILSNFTILEAEVTYGGIKSFGPFRVDIDKADIRNTTYLTIDRDTNVTLYFNHLPALSLTSINVIEDEPQEFDLSLFLTDSDGNIKDIMISSSSPHLTIDNVMKTMTVLYAGYQSYDIVQLNISDGISTVVQQVIVNITLVNDRPIRIKNIPEEFNVLENLGWNLNLAEYFTDEENPDLLTFTCSVPDIIIDNSSKTAYWNAEGSGMLQGVTITAWDMDGQLYVVSNPFTLSVTEVNDRPVYFNRINDSEVNEDTTWRINMMDYFTDEENKAAITFTSSDPRVHLERIGPESYYASWSPTQGDTSIVGLVITAHDASNYSLMVSTQPINLTFVPVDEPPQFIPSCLDGLQTTVYPGQTWMIILSDCFNDEENNKLNFTSNYGTQFRIYTDSYGQVRATYIAPKEATKDQLIKGLIFYATQTDGEARGKRAMTTPISFTYVVNQTITPPEPKVVFIDSKLAWYVYGSIPVAIIATAASFYTYRRVKFHKYEINDMFLIFNDGRLITHVTGSVDASALDKDILASMLTAIQDFVKESFSGREISSLKEMKYGEQNIVIERGIFAFLSIVVKGNVTEKLKDDMKDALRNIERTYANILEAWDGDNKKLGDIDENLNELVKKQPKNIIDLLRSY
jgi:parallel beta-helix repeat protein